MGKKHHNTGKRNTTKPQGTFTPDDVAQLYLSLWELGDAIATGNLHLIEQAHTNLFGLIPATTTNDGARTRARNIRRKQEEAQQQDAASASAAQKLEELAGIVAQLLGEQQQRLKKQRSFDTLSDEEQITQLRELWG